MAKPKTVSFTEMLIEVSMDASDATFSEPCLIVSNKAFTITASMNETAVPDCADPSAPAWIERQVDSLSAEFSGSGVMDAATHDIWRDWLLSGDPKTVRITIDRPLAEGGGSYLGQFKLGSLSHNGARSDNAGLVQSEVSGMSHGTLTWTDAIA